MLTIKEGSKVTITSGPLMGVSAVVGIATRPGHYLVHIDFIPSGASVECDASMLRLKAN